MPISCCALSRAPGQANRYSEGARVAAVAGGLGSLRRAHSDGNPPCSYARLVARGFRCRGAHRSPGEAERANAPIDCRAGFGARGEQVGVSVVTNALGLSIELSNDSLDGPAVKSPMS